MPITVYIPTPFRRLVGNRLSVEGEGSNVAEVFLELGERYPPDKEYDSRPRQ